MPVLFNVFKDFIPPGLSFDFVQQPFVFLFLFAITIFVSFISGIYPAMVLSGYMPAIVLKNQSFANKGETRHAWIRKTLTVSQFVVAQFFIIATIMVSKQINYGLNADLGFNKDGIITFNTPRDTVASHTQQLLNSINAIPGVEVASSGFLSPADEGVAFTNISYAPKKDVQPQVQIRWGNPEYISVYKIKLLAGRNVAASDTFREFLINDTYAKLLGFQKPNDAIGKYLSFNGRQMPIVGVMQDFHDQSMHAQIFPLVFSDGNGGTFHIRFKATGKAGIAWHNAIIQIQKAFKQMYPAEDFNYKFYDDTIAGLYQKEQQTKGLLSWATGLAILISCLGLLGLVMYTINTRTKEIGIRKILGASVTNILSVLSTDFIKLVCIAFLIAAPLAWWASYKWLEDFVYRTAMSWWVFVLAGIFMLLLALITLSFQTIKAAIANPVKSLRTE
jgi:ABC-type antimicrobial peptide transport system permease subunit